MRNRLLAFICMQGVLLCAQQKDTLRLYFDINVDHSEANDRRIDSLSKALSAKVYNVWIYGYADYLHSDSYNQALSLRRAEHIKSRLLQKSSEPQMSILACEGRGEKASRDRGTKEGELLQRRVDVVYELRAPNRVIDTRPQKPEPKSAAPKAQPAHETPPVKKIDVEELKKSGKFVLEGLSFVPGRHKLMPNSEPILQDLLNTMMANPELRIEIQGHVCCWDRPGDAYDYDSADNSLSLNRAKAVYDFLVENGIDADRMTYKGYGHSKPRVREVSPETEQMNRRVEIKVLK